MCTYTSFRGDPCCSCTAEWLAVFEQVAQERGVIDGQVKILQLRGSVPASAGTHAEGGCFDLGYYSGSQADDLVWIARQMGADATWFRDWDGNQHVHGVLTGCPKNWPAEYQIDAVRAGYNGLGYMGQEGPDDGPKPLSGRTWEQGIQWAEGELDMPLTDEDIKRIWAYQVSDGHADDGTSSVGTIMVRANPGPTGFAGAVANAVWENKTHTVFNTDPVTMKNMVRYGHGESTNGHKYAKEASGDINALQANSSTYSREGLVAFAALIGVLGVVLGAALTLALVAVTTSAL